MPDSIIGKLRIWGLLEGISFLALLFVAMPLKYIWEIPMAVKYVGAAHGGLFIFYCMWVLVATLEFKWSFSTIAKALIASVIPAGTFWADRNIFRKYEKAKQDSQSS